MSIRRRWSDHEDARLTASVEHYGAHTWEMISGAVGNERSAAMCRERWHYHIRPDVRKTDWQPEEDAVVIYAASMPLRRRWKGAAAQLTGRSAHAVRN
ncbi:Homeodomain-like protein, partial [Pavlovales sp. CCMP2436]